MNNKVSIYESIQKTEPMKAIEVSKVYGMIRDGSFKPETEKVLELEREYREGTAKKDDVDEAKKTLLKAATFSGSFPRSAGHVVEDTALCTGLMNLDIDDDNEAQALRQFRSKVSEIPWIEACWLSATGKLTEFLAVNARIELLDSLESYPGEIREHFNSHYDLNGLYHLYHEAINVELRKHGVQASDKAKDIKRLRLLSHDENIYVNEKCSTFTVEMLVKNLQEAKATRKELPKESPYKEFYAHPRQIPEGERNSTLFGVGCYLSGQGKMSNTDIVKEIRRINAEYCKPSLEKSEVTSIVKSVLTKRKQDETAKLAFPLTDLGNAERLVAQYGAKIRYCIDDERWYIYDGKRWEKDETGKMFQLAENTIRMLFESAKTIADEAVAGAVTQFARASENLSKLKAMIELASTQPGIPIQLREFDTQEYLVNVNNGTLDLRTKSLCPHSAKDLISRLIPLNYDPSLKRELWENTLGLVLKPEAVSFIQRILGYCFTGSTKEQKMFIFYGTGANGKTTILRTATNIMNEYASQSSIDTFLERKNDGILNDLARLQNRRLTLIPEYDESKKLSEALIKNVTGGDSITCRFLYCEYSEFVPKFKIVMATNHKPIIGGSDYGIKRRIVFVPFEYTIPVGDQNPKLMEDLEAEYPAILNWLVDGANQWFQHGLGIPQSIVDETANYLEENDVLDRFIRDVCLMSDEESIQSSVFFQHFQAWTEINNESELSQKAFSQKLMEKGYKREEKNHCRFYQGVSINPFSEVAVKVQKQKEKEKAEEARRTNSQSAASA